MGLTEMSRGHPTQRLVAKQMANGTQRAPFLSGLSLTRSSSHLARPPRAFRREMRDLVFPVLYNKAKMDHERLLEAAIFNAISTEK